MHSRWVVDNDPFDINQFMHPYQGAMYHGFARSAGLNYWESMGYTFAGSVLWEIRRRDDAAVEERSDRERHRRQFSRRAAVSPGRADASSHRITCVSGASCPRW